MMVDTSLESSIGFLLWRRVRAYEISEAQNLLLIFQSVIFYHHLMHLVAVHY